MRHGPTDDDGRCESHHWYLTMRDAREVSRGECVYMWDSMGADQSSAPETLKRGVERLGLKGVVK